ncbi:MAG: MFS transporter [Planctomycetaceae bacterium]
MHDSSHRSDAANTLSGPGPAITRGQWMALAAAILGWLFDGLEMGLFPLVGRDALRDLLQTADEGLVGKWFGVMIAGFLVGAAAGGVLFGWLGDRVGRVRAMTFSVLTYAIFTGLCGVAASAEQIFLFRFIASLGMGGEWSLGVSLVMEIWPNKSRGWLAGLIGAASNVGFLAIAVIGLGLTQVISSFESGLQSIGLPDETVTRLVSYSGWRILMLFGAVPALLTFFIRLFVPESQRWLHERGTGTTSHWATRDLIGVLAGTCGPLAMIYLWANDYSMTVRLVGSAVGLVVALLGYLYPVWRYLGRALSGREALSWSRGSVIGRMLIGAALSGTALLGTWASIQSAPSWAKTVAEAQAKREQRSDEREKSMVTNAAAYTQIASGLGAILGTILAATIGLKMRRRTMYCILCLTALCSTLLLYQGNTWFFDRPPQFGAFLLGTMFLAGCFTASFYGWLPLYLPELFPTAVRATGQGFAFNFGRILAAVGALQTGYLMNQVFDGDYARACSLMSVVYLVGLVIIWLAPETRGQPLPE